MNINSINSQSFNGISYASIKQKEIIGKEFDKWFWDTGLRERLAKKISKCINSKNVDIIVNANNDVFVLDKKNYTSTLITSPDNNLARKFLKSLSKAIELQK